MAGLFGKGAPAQPGDPTFWGTLDRVLGGMTVTEARADQRAAAQKQQLMSQLLDLVGGGYQPAPGPNLAAPTAMLPAPSGDLGSVDIGTPKVEGQSQPYTYAPPARTPPVPLTDPRWNAIGLLAPMAGVKLDNFLKIQELTKPTYERGLWVQPMDPNAPKYIPDLDKGQAPVMDGGQVVGVRNLPGAVQSAAEMAGATTGAQEQQKAAWDLVPVPLPNGTTQMLPRAVAAPLLASQAGNLGPGLGLSQSPAEQKAAEQRATAQTQAQFDFPTVAARATQSIGLIDSLLQDPNLNSALGWASKLPAIPGSPRVGIEAKLDQLQGTAFLQAYNDLKGAGQITETEGAKAEVAVARLKRHDQSPDDYRAALSDLRDVISAGAQRAQQKATMPAVGGRGIRPDRAAVAAELRKRGLLQ